MKKTIFFFSAVVLLLVVMAGPSCRKVEREPKDWFGADIVFDSLDQNAIVASYNLNDIYNYIPGGFNRIGGDFLDAASGDAVPSRNNTAVEYYTNGRINVLNNPDPYWASSYYGIRRANIFIANIDKVPTAAITKRYWKAEARFIRSLLYWELVKRYGGVPLIDDKVFTLDDNLELPRNSFNDCVNYIVSECNAVKDSLRPEPVSDAEWGRIPRGAAVALKCRVLLYAASPLFNGGGVESDPVKKALTGYVTADPNRWQKVVDAAEEFNVLGYYSLVQTGAPTPFASVFTVKKNTEVILAKQTSNNSNLEVSQSPVSFISAGTASQGLTSPTQNFVDAFTDTTGLAITEAGSVYSAATPYAKRDPRLRVSVFTNGTIWLKDTVKTYEGGKDKPNTTVTQTKTGYYLRKFLADFTTSSTYSGQSHNFIIFRYAEILLNYAEALNEVGRTSDAVTQIISLRKRAGLVPGATNRYGIKTGITQAEMQDLIRTERRVELAFEDHRFWDLRRWKIAPQVLSTPLNGMKIIRTGNTYTYQVVPVTAPIFTNRLYHMPLPYDEITKNKNLIQNEGW